MGVVSHPRQTRLNESVIDLDARITLAHGIKDMMDMSNAMRSATFVEIMLPAILDVLLTFEPVMISKSQENVRFGTATYHCGWALTRR